MLTDESKQSQKRAKRTPRSQQSLNDSDAQTDGQTSGTSMTGRQLDGARKDSGFQRCCRFRDARDQPVRLLYVAQGKRADQQQGVTVDRSDRLRRRARLSCQSRL